MAEEKIYVGNGVSKFDGDQVACSVCLTDLPQEHMFEYNDKKYIKLLVQKKKTEDDYGKTHYVAVDTWKPDPNKAAATGPTGTTMDHEGDDDLPF